MIVEHSLHNKRQRGFVLISLNEITIQTIHQYPSRLTFTFTLFAVLWYKVFMRPPEKTEEGNPAY